MHDIMIQAHAVIGRPGASCRPREQRGQASADVGFGGRWNAFQVKCPAHWVLRSDMLAIEHKVHQLGQMGAEPGQLVAAAQHQSEPPAQQIANPLASARRNAHAGLTCTGVPRWKAIYQYSDRQGRTTLRCGDFLRASPLPSGLYLH